MTHLILKNTSYFSVLQAQYLDTYSCIGSSHANRGLPENARGGLVVMSANGAYEREPASLLAG